MNVQTKMNGMRSTALLLLAGAMMFCGSLRAQEKKAYPYVTTNKEGKMTVIVCREGDRGIDDALIHENWTTTPSHYEDEAENAFAARFEVSESDGIQYGTGWRKPTIRELRLIYALRTKLDGQSFDKHLDGDNIYESRTLSRTRNEYWGVDFDDGMTIFTTGNIGGGSSSMRLRCVKDLE